MVLRTGKLWSRIADDFKPLPENKQGPGTALTEEQERKLFQTAASRPEWSVAFYAATLAADTATRGCEIKGLRLQDIDLMNRTVSIRRSSTKTDAGARIIPLNDSACWAMARLLERAARIGAQIQIITCSPLTVSATPARAKVQPGWGSTLRNQW